jgi:hypothetical protein
MAMKQTQTKMFDFSDVGLDFCAGSKSLFPDRFKKMLSLGYNTQTVASVAVSGNQVTLTYGVTHGYASDRVLKVNSGPLSLINNGEFWIDSVTTNTVTMTIDNAPVSIAGAFTTNIASLGWQLEYEQANIQIYRFKHIDDTDRFARFCFENVQGNRNAVAVCVGKTANLSTGVISDQFALQITAAVTSPSSANLPKWDTYQATSAHNNWSYSQGVNTYGKGMAVGSLYHFAFLSGDGYTQNAPHHIYGIFPAVCHKYTQLEYPVIIGLANSNDGNTTGSMYGNFSRISTTMGHASIGNIRVRFDQSSLESNSLLSGDQSTTPTSSFLSEVLDSFNTTTVKPFEIYENKTSQHIGYVYGLYQCMYKKPDQPVVSISNSPHITKDVDFNNLIVIAISSANLSNDLNSRFIAVPVEMIKYA